MTARGFLLLFLVTAVAVAGAAWSIARDPRVVFANRNAEIAFPALHANPDAAAKLVLTTGEGRFTFTRVAHGSWVARDKHDYPVSKRRMRDVATQLADMRRIEAKTRLPERYARIGVEPPDTPQANSAMLRLENAKGEVLAETILGERVWRQTGPARNGTFIRAPDGAQAWLASGGVDLAADLVDWLDRAIVNIETDEVAKVEVIPPEGQPYLIVRKVAGSDFSLLSAKGPLRLDRDAARKLASGLTRLTFEDVVPGTEKEIGAGRTRVDVTRFDGLKVSIVFLKSEDGTWAEVTAGTAKAAKDDAEAVRERAAALNDRLGGWAYKIADWQRAKLATPLERLMAKAKN